MKITYQRRDGSILEKFRSSALPYKIGETTSMGWKVLNIEYEYKDKYYSTYDYYNLLNKEKQKYLKRKKIKQVFVSNYKPLLNYFVIVIINNIVTKMLGI